MNDQLREAVSEAIRTNDRYDDAIDAVMLVLKNLTETTKFQQDTFAAVMQEVNNFAAGTATIDLDADEQAEVAVVFARAIGRVQREHYQAEQDDLKRRVEELRQSKGGAR